MLTCEFDDTASDLSADDRALITALAVEAAEDIARLLPIAVEMRLVVGATATPLSSTRDNAYTASPSLIHWFYDASANAVDVAHGHLRKAFFHEAFHATRFQRLQVEAEIESWVNVALGEGLACVFARDHADAHEEWCSYDGEVIEDWARELLARPWGDFEQWKFEHSDGRTRIAFRVGVWLVDEILRTTGQRIEDLLWVPLGDLVQQPTVALLTDDNLGE